MILDPDAQRLLDMIRESGRPPYDTLSTEQARELYRASRAVLQPEAPAIGEVRDLAIPGLVPLRLYRGRGAAGACPLLIYFHGGGWVLGDLDSHDGACRRIANDSACLVISVDYRLAPEHRFPLAVEDCAAATRWIMDQAAAFGADPARIAVGGDSAGGNLAAVMALMARDGALPAIGFQLLIYPAVDMSATQPSYERIVSGYPLTAGTMRWFRDQYLNNAAERNDWRASPLRAASLAGTAPAFVITAGHDPLCDEGVAYAERLEQEGVHVAHLHLADQIHGFLTMGRVIRAADLALDAINAALRTHWRPRP
ncbi:MAG: alpha/beta hydrolase [Rhodospirillales bacterium]|nr:alpha/beta hydrolase [Rhodospirillales bacterium]